MRILNGVMVIRLSRELDEDERLSIERIMLEDNDGVEYPMVFMDVELAARLRNRISYRMSSPDSSETTQLLMGKEYSVKSVTFSIDTEDEDLTVDEIDFLYITTDQQTICINTYGCDIFVEGI